MENNYGVYEDNEGGLYLCILNEERECIRIYEGWEYGYPGELRKAIRHLQECPDAYGELGPDLAEEAQRIGFQPDSREVLYGRLGTLIAYATYDGYLWLSENMSIAGRRALGVEE